jgi:hypothetical protein
MRPSEPALLAVIACNRGVVQPKLDTPFSLNISMRNDTLPSSTIWYAFLGISSEEQRTTVGKLA